MIVKELMVGDLIKLGKRILRCKNILGHTNDVMLENGVVTNVMNIEPIPLTPEILEKNGFVVESRDYHGNPLQYCALVDGLWIDISGENYFEGKLEYVHQLQHALRLCGIEKEIIL